MTRIYDGELSAEEVVGSAPGELDPIEPLIPQPSHLRLSLIVPCLVSMTVRGVFLISSTPLSLFAG
jgi:hypothetical protein